MCRNTARHLTSGWRQRARVQQHTLGTSLPDGGRGPCAEALLSAPHFRMAALSTSLPDGGRAVCRSTALGTSLYMVTLGQVQKH